MRSQTILVIILQICLCSAIYNGKRGKDEDMISSMAHFGFRDGNKVAWVCGGVLITWKHVLTAAHCDVSAEDDVVYVGTRKLHDESKGCVFNIEKADVSPYYSTETYANDLQIVTLEGDSKRRLKCAGIKPIDIEWNASDIPLGSRFKIMGFGGKDAIVGAPIQKKLRIGWSFSADRELCSAKYSVDTDPEETICMDGTGSTACSGDSGGPVIYYSREQRTWKLAGIVSGGEPNDESCTNGEKWHANNVETHFGWIKEVTGRYSRRQWYCN